MQKKSSATDVNWIEKLNTENRNQLPNIQRSNKQRYLKKHYIYSKKVRNVNRS